jgi:hypothetical protein
MDQPILLEPEPIDERLECRAGGTQRVRHIDLAGPLVVEITGGADAGQHLPGRMIYGEDRDRDVRPERAGPLPREIFQACLPGRVDGEVDQGPARQGRNRIIGGVRSERRHRHACGRHWLGLGLHDLRRVEDASSRNPVQHAVA